MLTPQHRLARMLCCMPMQFSVTRQKAPLQDAAVATQVQPSGMPQCAPQPRCRQQQRPQRLPRPLALPRRSSPRSGLRAWKRTSSTPAARSACSRCRFGSAKCARAALAARCSPRMARRSSRKVRLASARGCRVRPSSRARHRAAHAPDAGVCAASEPLSGAVPALPQLRAVPLSSPALDFCANLPSWLRTLSDRPQRPHSAVHHQRAHLQARRRWRAARMLFCARASPTI